LSADLFFEVAVGEALAAEVALDDFAPWTRMMGSPSVTRRTFPDRNDTSLTAIESRVMVEMTIRVPVTD
jgi:hypothetical protein